MLICSWFNLFKTLRLPSSTLLDDSDLDDSTEEPNGGARAQGGGLKTGDHDGGGARAGGGAGGFDSDGNTSEVDYYEGFRL